MKEEDLDGSSNCSDVSSRICDDANMGGTQSSTSLELDKKPTKPSSRLVTDCC